MKVKIFLRYAREPELVALRFNPGIHMPGLTKQALQAQMEGQDFQIHIQKDVNYVPKPLSFYLTLDNEVDREIIQFLNSQCAPVTVFIRNALLRCIKGNIDFIYKDLELKKMALSDCRQHTKLLSAMKQEENEDVLLLAAQELETV